MVQVFSNMWPWVSDKKVPGRRQNSHFAQTRVWLPVTHACCCRMDRQTWPFGLFFCGGLQGDACGSHLLYIIGFGLYFKQECVVCQTKITQFKEYVWLLRAGTAEKPTPVLDEIQYGPT